MHLPDFIKTVAQALFQEPVVEEKQVFGHTVFNIETADGEQFLNHEGEALRALNHVVKRVQEKEGTTTFSVVDVNNHDTEKLERLVTQALELGERVKEEGHEIELQPMNSYERLLVHDALKDVSGVRTESRGGGRERHIVLLRDEN